MKKFWHWCSRHPYLATAALALVLCGGWFGHQWVEFRLTYDMWPWEDSVPYGRASVVDVKLRVLAENYNGAYKEYYRLVQRRNYLRSQYGTDWSMLREIASDEFINDSAMLDKNIISMRHVCIARTNAFRLAEHIAQDGNVETQSDEHYGIIDGGDLTYEVFEGTNGKLYDRVSRINRRF